MTPTPRRVLKQGTGVSRVAIAVAYIAVMASRLRRRQFLGDRGIARTFPWYRTIPLGYSLSIVTAAVGSALPEKRIWTSERVGYRPERFANGTEWSFRTRSVRLCSFDVLN